MPLITKATAYTLIRQHLGYNNALDETIIDANVNNVQARYETGAEGMPLPWFTFDAGANGELLADYRTFDLFERFVAFDDEWPVSIEDDAGTYYVLERAPNWQVADQALRNGDDVELRALGVQGRPVAWNTMGTKMYFYPRADVQYRIHAPCYRQSEVPLSQDTESASLWWQFFPHLIITSAALAMASAGRDEGILKQLLAWEQTYRMGYIRKCNEMRLTLRDIYIGNEDEA